MFDRYRQILKEKRRVSQEKKTASPSSSFPPERKHSRGNTNSKSNSQGDILEDLYFSEENSRGQDMNTPASILGGEKEEGEKESEDAKLGERREIGFFSSSSLTETKEDQEEEGRKDEEKVHWEVEEDLLKCPSFLPSVCRETPLSMEKLKRELHIEPTPLVDAVRETCDWLDYATDRFPKEACEAAQKLPVEVRCSLQEVYGHLEIPLGASSSSSEGLSSSSSSSEASESSSSTDGEDEEEREREC
ncbi:nad dependent epimerase dehydratase family protein [Cystoisospora suis]|uniref:Nad dependent epimerase dehydratase family protein n=1 Tax=Cystoisospora suis TaxID=483139 RepID=A0A2C6KGZ3_9APIC|nr:nad dependent epimerase dehydratase family protein [Cystoisospora suis]